MHCTEPQHGNNLCLQCGKLALSSLTSVGVCWNTDCCCTQGAGRYGLPYLRHSDVPERNFVDRLRDLSAILFSDFKYLRENRALCDILATDLVDVPHCPPSGTSTLTTSKVDGQDLSARIGILVFYRLLGSLQRSKNTRGILKLLKQVPSIIANMPVLSLSPRFPTREYPGEQFPTDCTPAVLAGLTTGISTGGVVEAIMSAAEGLICGEHELSGKQQGDVLGALVGLAIKQGSLVHCLRVVRLLFCTAVADSACPIPGVGHHFKGLEATAPCALGDAGVRELGVPPLPEYREAGMLLSLGEAQGREPQNEDILLDDASIPDTLRGVRVLKVDSTASQSIALTADGELLAWSRIARKTTTDDGVVAEAATISSPTLDQPWNAHALQAATQDVWGLAAGGADCGYSRCCLRSDRLTDCRYFKPTSTRVTWQVLAYKPTVRDVACGLWHTLALLETGQVFSWGSGCNGQLGLRDTRSRLFACHVEAIEAVKIEAVYCGVFHSMAVCSKGTSYAWGKNSRGQCGHRDTITSDTLSPRVMEGLEGFQVAAMSGGWEHTLALTRCGEIFSFGDGCRVASDGNPTPVWGVSAAATVPNGTLGERDGALPTKICDDALGSARIKSISSGWHHCMVVTDDGALFTWGSGRSGQLGHGDTEPRHVPTRVAFFSTPAGGRVCSATGGRTYSAAVTVDGRLFHWGVNCHKSPLRIDDHGRDKRDRQSQGNNHNEEDGTVAQQASVPCQVAGVGTEGPRAVRLGEGSHFDMVVVELQPTAEPHLPVGDVRNEAERVASSTRYLLASAGLDVPEDPSEPIDRAETTVALLRHLERMATPYMPSDINTDVNRSVRHALRVGRRVFDGMTPEIETDTQRPVGDVELSTAESVDQQHSPKKHGLNIPCEEHLNPEEPTPTGSTNGPDPEQETRATACRTSAPVIPFCVDTSVEAFRSFLDLIKGVRQTRTPASCTTVRTPAETQATGPPAVLKSKRIDQNRNPTGATGPEGSPCDKIHPGGYAEKAFASQSIKQQHHQQQRTAHACTKGFAVASRSVQLEVLRCTLKLLKLNLYHLVRVSTVRRSCRGNYSWGIHARGTCGAQAECEDVRGRCDPEKSSTGRTEGNVCVGHCSGSRSKNDASGSGRGNENTEAAVLERLEQNGDRLDGGGAEDMQGVITELHAALRELLEKDVSEEPPEAAKAGKAVQVEAAEAFRVGFSIFFPSNRTRVRLLQDVIKAIPTTNYSWSPEHTREEAADKSKLKRSQVKPERDSFAPGPKSIIMKIALEGLAREGYAAALVAGALSHEGSGRDKREIGTGDESMSEGFEATELDSAMRSLLSYCSSDLNDRLPGKNVRSKSTKGSSCLKDGNAMIYEGEAQATGCPHSRLLLVLQAHVISYWRTVDGDAARTSAACEVSLAHASRLLGESLKIFSWLLGDKFQTGDSAEDKRCRYDDEASIHAVRNSFVLLVPLLCTSVVAVPTDREGCISRAAVLLPIVLPLMGAVDRFNRSRRFTTSKRVHVVHKPLGSCHDGGRSACWFTGLEEALAMLYSGLVCDLTELKQNKVPRPVGHLLQGTCGDDRGDNDECSEDVVELLLKSSPFLAHGRESFDCWNANDEVPSSQLDGHDFSQALEVIAFQEQVTQEVCGCSQPPVARTSGSTPKGWTSKQSLPHGRRRTSGDNAAKLSPIDLSASSTSLSHQKSPSNAAARSLGSVGNIALGDESSRNGNQRVAGAGGVAEAENSGGRSGAATGRQLDSIVDEARAEGFLQDFVSGHGAAQALYKWMAVPPGSQFPVLHASSLATQGQGWGSYQSLSSHSATAVGPDQPDTLGNHRRRRSRALSSDVDAATRALVAVVIKSNGVVVEAATFARCRLDRASSPPPALKLVAAAAAEVHEALVGLADLLEEEQGAPSHDTGKRDDCQGDASGGDHGQRHQGQRLKAATNSPSAASTLATIVCNCRFLLSCTHLPAIELVRKSSDADVKINRRQCSTSRLPTDAQQQIRRELSRTLQRWASDARQNANAATRPPSSLLSDPPKQLAIIAQHMAKGRVERALSAVSATQKPSLSPTSANLESLLGFAANPIPLSTLEARMRYHELRAKVRASGFQLVHTVLHEVQITAARRQIGARLARSLTTSAGDMKKPTLFDGIGAAGDTATSLVRSAYVGLFRHVVYEVEQEHCKCRSQEEDPLGSTPRSVFLPLLQTLATMLSPQLLHSVGSTSSSKTRVAPDLTDTKIMSMPPRMEQAASISAGGQGRSGRPGRASSTPSLGCTDARVSPRLPIAGEEAAPVLIAALSVLGAVLGGKGDLLACDVQGPGRDSDNTNSHHAAWRALVVVSKQVCMSASAFTGHVSSGGGTSGSRSAELCRHNVAREWWVAIETMLSILFNEAERARERLEQLQRNRRDEEGVMAATRAVRLLYGPASLPLPPMQTFSGSLGEGTSEGFALSFWVWVPSYPAILNTSDLYLDPFGEGGNSKTRSDSENSDLRSMEILTWIPGSPAESEPTTIGAHGRTPHVFLTRSASCELKEGTVATGARDEFYVEFVLARGSNPQQHLAVPADNQAAKMEERGRVQSTDSTATRNASNNNAPRREPNSDGEDGGGIEQDLETRTLLSDIPLAAGRWTHVCCMYTSNTEAEHGPSPGRGSAGGTASCASIVVAISFNGSIVAKQASASCDVDREKDPTRGLKRSIHNQARTHDQFGYKAPAAAYPQATEGTPAVRDLHWHQYNVSEEHVRQMANTGIPTQGGHAHSAAESYVLCLVALAGEIASSSQRAAATMSSPRWLSLWLTLVAVSGQHAQRAILRLLRHLLCIPSKIAGENAENVTVKSKAPLRDVVAPNSHGHDLLGDRAVVERLCRLLGDSLVPILHRRWSYGLCESDVEQARTISDESSYKPSPVHERSALASDLVLLLRSLLQEAPNRWRESIFAVLADGLATTAKGELLVHSQSMDGKRRSTVDGGIQPQTWLGAAAIAAYLGGGLIEGPRIGATVVLMSRPRQVTTSSSNLTEGAHRGTAKEGAGIGCVYPNICVSGDVVVLSEEAVKSTCRGTIVGWTQTEGSTSTFQERMMFVAVDERHQACLDEASSLIQTTQGRHRPTGGPQESVVESSCRVVAVPFRQATFVAETVEPVTPFLFTLALPSIIALLELSTIPKTRIDSCIDQEESPCGVSDELGASVVTSHLRCRLIRAIAVQLRYPHQANAALQGQVLPLLLALGASNLASAAVLALGSNVAVAFSRQANFAAVVLSLGHRELASPRCTPILADLESACQVVWSRLTLGKREREWRRRRHRSRSAENRRHGGRGNYGTSCSRPALQVLGGEALVEVNRVTASSHFPTIRLSHVGLGVGPTSGRWYYEVTLLTGGLMQIGWAGPLFQCNPVRGQGVGDHRHSWAFDGFRQKRWRVSSAPYGKRWRAGDVVGVLLDAGLQEMRFSLNGHDLGVAFVGFDTEGLYPAASMNVGQAAHFNFGCSPFLHTPTETGDSSFRPVSEAAATIATVDPNSAEGARRCEQRLPGDTGAGAGGDRGTGERAGGNDQQDARELSPRMASETRGDDAGFETGGDSSRTRLGNDGGDTRGGTDQGNPHAELQRQRLVEHLIGMGFPVEWAIRAAERCGEAMNESAATAWIIERLEIENSKMEEEMGNMDTCEEGSTGDNSGTGDEYNEEESAFVYASEAAGAEAGLGGAAGQTVEDTSDRRWHDMYSAVRRSFLARNDGESPATAARYPAGQHGTNAHSTPGEAAEAAVAENELKISSRKRAAATEGLDSSSHELMKVAMSTDERDLPFLSLVLDTALSILFARAAIVNLLSHVGGGSGKVAPQYRLCTQRSLRVGPTCCPWSWTSVGETGARPASTQYSWHDGGRSNSMAMEVAQGITDTLKDPQRQRLIVDITKVFVTWHPPPRRMSMDTPFQVPPVLVEALALTKNATVIMRRNRSLENIRPIGFFHSPNANHPLGLLPGSCALAILSLLTLAFDSVENCDEGKSCLSARPSSAQRTPHIENRASPMILLQVDDVIGEKAVLALARLVTLFVEEAVSLFECNTAPDSSVSTDIDAPLASGRGRGISEPPDLHSNLLWAIGILDTLQMLEKTHSGVERTTSGRSSKTSALKEPVWTVSSKEESFAVNGTNPVMLAVATGRSPRSFAAVLRLASRNDLDEPLRRLAYYLCSCMLNASRLTTSTIGCFGKDHNEAEAVVGATTATKRDSYPEIRSPVPTIDEYAQPSQERSLAREFSAGLRGHVNTQDAAPPLLQSQLEILAQWEIRRSAAKGRRDLQTDGTFRLHEEEWGFGEARVSTDRLSPPQVWTHPGRERTDSWDVATTSFAAGEGEADGSDTAQAKNARTMGQRRPGTTESEPSALSSVPTAPLRTKISSTDNISLLVEAATATSITVSWGGWLDNDYGPEMQVGVDSDAEAYPTSCGKVDGVSDLAQALRSKLNHATSRRRGQGPGLVLKVGASGLWGSEPFRVAALDLDSCGCLKIHGLTADTRYAFRLERPVASPSPPRAPLPEGAEMLDDEHSCFPSAATIGASSIGDSTADPTEGDLADLADGASSALTGLDESRGGGGGCGEASVCSEGYTTVRTDESHTRIQASCASSTRAVAGRHANPSGNEIHTNPHVANRKEWQWPSIVGHERPHGIPGNPSAMSTDGDSTAAGGYTTIVATINVATPPQTPFMLDAEACGPNLRLTNSNLTVANTGRKKWSAVRATRGFSSGVHRWKVQIDRCISKNVFVGVVSSESRLNNYVGSDRSGWGYLANKAIWHNKGKVRSYGDLFREGDTIGVSLNMDLGTLRFTRNGRDLGVAVQGLEGTLYPAVSMYNRNDQLTLVPPEDHAAPIDIPSASGYGGDKRNTGPTRAGSGAYVEHEASNVLFGSFSAECVVRRASKALQVLGALAEKGGFNSPAGVDLVDNIRSCMFRWSRGEQRMSVSSARACAPVCLDTSEQTRRDFFGLGTGDRIMSAEGKATVLGATKHSLWVSVETSSPMSACSSSLDREPRAWDSEMVGKRQEDALLESRGHTSAVGATTMSRPSHRSFAGKRGKKATAWSRGTIRHIVGRPGDYAINRGTTTVSSPERLVFTSSTSDDRGGTACQNEAGVAPAVLDLLRTNELGSMLSRWTRTMDEELVRRLEKLAELMALTSPLDLPFEALKQLTVSTGEVDLPASIAPAEVYARATLLLYVNEIVLPLLPLVDTSLDSLDGRAPLCALVHRCRHLILTDAKLSLPGTTIRRATTGFVVSPSETGAESAPAFTIPLSGIKSLPTTPAACHVKGSNPPSEMLSWVQRSREVDKSVFGQVARHVSLSPQQFLSEEPMAFFVELTDAAPLVEEGSNTGDLQPPDAQELYRGVFWQVCAEVCSPPISMFALRPEPAAEKTEADDTAGGGDATTRDIRPEASSVDYGAAPDPFFSSDLQSPVMCMDPERVALYRSLGFIVGLAVRTGVPLPSFRLTATWWMLVANESISTVEDFTARGNWATTRGGKRGESKTSSVPGLRQPCPDEALSADTVRGRSPRSVVARVLAVFDRLEEVGTAREELEELLADARFVAPLSNGHVVELLPGGSNRAVTRENIGEYRAHLFRFGASEYATQASAFRTGLEAALPRRVLSLLTWREMQELVCG